MRIEFGAITVNLTDPAALAIVTRIEQKLDAMSQRENQNMAALDDKLDTLTAQVTANTTVIGSAKVMIGGFAQLLADAIAAAGTAGATTAQLAALSALETTIKGSDDELAAAIAARTPGAVPAP